MTPHRAEVRLLKQIKFVVTQVRSIRMEIFNFSCSKDQYRINIDEM